MVTPYSYSYEKKDAALDQKVNMILDEEKQSHPVTQQFEIEMVPVKGKFEGKKVDMGRNKQDSVTKDYQLVSQSVFNQIAKKMDVEAVNLAANEAFVLDGMYIEGHEFSPVYKGNKAAFPVGNETKTLTIKGAEGRTLTNLGELFVVVPDEVYNSAKKVSETRIVKNIDVKDEKNGKVLTEKLRKVMPAEAGKAEFQQTFNDFYTGFHGMMEATGLMMFIGLFLGLVFLLATGSIIYFKQLTEASADRNRYIVLRKVGVTKKEMKKAIAKQAGFIFAIPLVVGICRSLLALKGLKTVMPNEILIPLLMSIGVYSVIYIGYYFLTVRSYYKIVSKK